MERNGEAPHHSNGLKSSANGSARHISVIHLTSDKRRRPNVELADKVALIVGGASAQGQSLARSFAERDIDIVLVYFNGDHRRATEIKEDVLAEGRRCLLISGEGADQEADEQFALEAMRQILNTFGRLDIFINFSARSFPIAQLLQTKSEPQSLRGQIFPQFQIMKAALDEILG